MSEASTRRANWLEWLTVLAFCAFLFFFGLGAIGLTGADEPRYAQIAREMLARHDCITPVLYGKPWLEKPILYYWEAMVAYKFLGVSDWAARLPSAFSASAMVLGIFAFMRRCRPAAALDAALITAASAACIGFARAASTDMPLAAMFTLAMLCWIANCRDGASSVSGVAERDHASEKKPKQAPSLRILFFVFIALATLAKGPVAPLLAGLIITVYAALARDWSMIRRTLWWPGILLFFALAAPWYVAVQSANPQFAREFFLQQNLARFGTNLYRHRQPFWYYIPVLLVGLVPWTIFTLAEYGRSLRVPSNFALRRDKNSFLLIWAIVPIIFFSLSQSKLPGYILPAIPAWTILLAVRLHEPDGASPVSTGTSGAKPSWAIVIPHALLAAALVSAAIVLPAIVMHTRLAGRELGIALAAGILLAAGIAYTVRSRGVRMLRFATLIPVVIALAYVIRVDAPALDAKVSTRPLAAQIVRLMPKDSPVAVFRARREVEYGLAFYLDHAVSNYDRKEIPAADHLVVAPRGAGDDLKQAAAPRRVSRVGEYQPQNLELFWISAARPASMPH